MAHAASAAEASPNAAPSDPGAMPAGVPAAQTTDTYVKTASGLQYADIKVGTGPVAHTGNKVIVHYTGWLKGRLGMPGKKFDSSYDHNEPFEFVLGAGEVIQGWDEGVQGMRVGGTRKLIIPSSLGYGMKGAGTSIPANATLLFDVELLGI